LWSAAQEAADSLLRIGTGPAVNIGSTLAFGRAPTTSMPTGHPIRTAPKGANSKQDFWEQAKAATAQLNPTVDRLYKSSEFGRKLPDLADVGASLAPFIGTSQEPSKYATFGERVKKAQMQEFKEDVSRRAKYLPEDERQPFIGGEYDRAGVEYGGGSSGGRRSGRGGGRPFVGRR
jgi:hypothetical protein